MKYIDLFAGIGGFHLAFSNIGGWCVFASEIDCHARKTYQLNLQADQFNNDITLIDPLEIPDHDILCGGFPCQPFSIAGYQKGFDDSRGELIFQVAKILETKQPQAFLLENVKNLYSHNQGKTYQTIKQLLENAGYSVQEKIMNTMDYGFLPQNRERLYIVGFKNDKASQRFTFPDTQPLTLSVKDLLETDVDDCFYYNNKPLYSELKDAITDENTVYQWRRKYVRENKKGVCPTLTANMGTGGHNVPLIKDKKSIRKLTPTECLRLQGFPSDYRFPEKMPLSHQYKQVGNSVTVTVVERIARQISHSLN